jgi:hypothetical protein
MKPETLKEIKKAMGYSEPDERCCCCQHYVQDSQCDINAFLIPVSPQGSCMHGTFSPICAAE